MTTGQSPETEARKVMQATPTKHTTIRPLGYGSDKLPQPGGEIIYQLNFLVSDSEVVTVAFPEEIKDAIVRDLTGVSVVRA